MVAREAHNLEVAGSIPASPTRFLAMVALPHETTARNGRAVVFQANRPCRFPRRVPGGGGLF